LGKDATVALNITIGSLVKGQTFSCRDVTGTLVYEQQVCVKLRVGSRRTPPGSVL